MLSGPPKNLSDDHSITDDLLVKLKWLYGNNEGIDAIYFY